MLRWSFTFFLLAMSAAFFGFQGEPLRWSTTARAGFFSFLFLFLLTFGLALWGEGRQRSPR